jgi:hypothetical protein
MAVTIDKLDIGVYIQYARSIQLVEETKEEFQLDKASAIPPQTQLVDFAPKFAEVDLLLGYIPSKENQWAFFFPPRKFKDQRRSPFSRDKKKGFSILGDEKDEQILIELLDGVDCKTAEEEVEREILKTAVKRRKHINDMIDDVMNHIGMFVQG